MTAPDAKQLPTRAADFQGAGARAWQVPLELPPSDLAWAACVGVYLVHQPGVHAFWSWWYVGCVHLRPIPGTPPAHLQRPGMTHELLAIALNPELHPHELPDLAAADLMRRAHTGQGLGFLMPFDQVHQFAVGDDAQAARLLSLVVRACCDGALSPDTDYRASWATVVDATAQHFRDGHHQVA